MFYDYGQACLKHLLMTALAISDRFFCTGDKTVVKGCKTFSPCNCPLFEAVQVQKLVVGKDNGIIIFR
ncbi:MAG: hypothetical protein KJ846_03200 [Proteobacteria bacterium]|nr:hypothetical protein [Pseudomonadota bacterium]